MSWSRTPNIIHPVKVVYEILDRDATLYDESAREPARQAVRTGAQPNTGNRVTIKGQIMFYYAGGRIGSPMYDRRGVDENTDGYMAVRVKDLLRVGLATKNDDGSITYNIKRGDRIIQHGHRKVNLYVTEFEDFAYYPRKNQTMLQINFQDRHPTHQRGNL